MGSLSKVLLVASATAGTTMAGEMVSLIANWQRIMGSTPGGTRRCPGELILVTLTYCMLC